MKKNENIQSVERAFSILECFNEENTNYGLVELARKVNLPVSSTQRMVNTLEDLNYLYKDEKTLKYYLGFKLIQLSNVAFDNIEITNFTREYIELLFEKYNESTGVYIPKGCRRICIDRIETTNDFRENINIGSEMPINLGASGKAIMAFLSEGDLINIENNCGSFSRDELSSIKKTMIAISYGERTPGVVSVSSPIIDVNNEPRGAIFISLPEVRSSKQLIENMGKDIRASAIEISKHLGCKLIFE